MFRRAIALSLMLASVPATAASTLTFNFAGAPNTNTTASSYQFTETGSQGTLTLTASALKFFPTPEALVGTNVTALTTTGLVTQSGGTSTSPAGLGVSGGASSPQIDTNQVGTVQAPLREALLLSGNRRFSIHSLTLNFVDVNDTLLVFGIGPDDILVRLGFGSTVTGPAGNAGTIQGGLDGLATSISSTPVVLNNAQGNPVLGQFTEAFSVAPTELYNRYLFTTRVGGDVIFGGDIGQGYQVLGLTGALPEPGTWAMMIGGFGLAGASLRRRRAAVAA
jgi:hypothetical protein